MSNSTFTPAELSFLTWQHRSIRPGPCRVCGAPLALGRMGGGKATVYHCSSDEASSIEAYRQQPGDTPASRREREKAAMEHWRGSEISISYHGDPTVGRLVAEVRGMRIERGENMDVAVGERYFPYGHGKGICSTFFVHRGGDVWEHEMDLKYSHDPDHATLEVPEEEEGGDDG